MGRVTNVAGSVIPYGQNVYKMGISLKKNVDFMTDFIQASHNDKRKCIIMMMIEYKGSQESSLVAKVTSPKVSALKYRVLLGYPLFLPCSYVHG